MSYTPLPTLAREISRDRTVTDTQQAIFLALLDLHDQQVQNGADIDAPIEVTHMDLKEFTGKSRTTIGKAIEALMAGGWVTRELTRSGLQSAPTRYWLHSKNHS